MKLSPRRRTLRFHPFAFVLLLVAFVTAPSARSQERRNEFGVWGAYSVNSPDVFGSQAHQQFGALGFRYGRIVHSSPLFSIEYTADVEPVEIARPRTFVSCEIVIAGTVYLTECPSHETVYAGGISPIGLKFNFLRRSHWQPVLATSGGSVVSTRPIPVDVPMATQFNFTFDFQVGVEHFNFSHTRAWTFSYKLQHISNAGRSAINPGVDLDMLSVGYSFFK
jgi:Lipid A 3-O-deacylase (PagL)